MRRVEYYNVRGGLYEVTTCACCNFEGYQDAWYYSRKEYHHTGVNKTILRVLRAKLITEKEAVRRAEQLGKRLYYNAEEIYREN